MACQWSSWPFLPAKSSKQVRIELAGWYIIGMIRQRLHRYQQTMAMVLMLVFLGSQIFSCCLVNQRIGQFLATAFTSKNIAQAPAHSCCPKPAKTAGSDRASKSDPSQHKECCIQDANQRLPQIPSEMVLAPGLPEWVVRILPIAVIDLPVSPNRSALRSASDPPLYLTQRRILI
jgi:hypothetical protein